MIDITRFLSIEQKERAVAAFAHNNSLSKYDLNKQMIIALLRTYKDIQGNLLVKLNYLVPLDDSRWPVWSQGCKLGMIVRKLRNCYSEEELDEDEIKELEDMGMIWDVEEYINQLTVYGLEIYKDIYGDLNIPDQFIIPSQPSTSTSATKGQRASKTTKWPRELWGQDLGAIAQAIRTNETAYRAIVPALRNLDFPLLRRAGRGHSNSASAGTHRYEGIEDVLSVYKEINGNLLIPQRYVIPEDDDRYPERYRGRSLGSICHNIRYNQLYREQREDLIGMGFEELERKTDRVASGNHPTSSSSSGTPTSTNRSGRGNFEECKAALKVYKSLYGNLFVPYDYVIPKDNEHFAEAYRGRALGSIVRNIIYNNQYRDYREELTALGLEYNKAVYKEQCKLQQQIHLRLEQEQSRLQQVLGGPGIGPGTGTGSKLDSDDPLSSLLLPATSSSSSAGAGPGGGRGRGGGRGGRGGGPATPRATFPEVFEGLKCYQRLYGDFRIPQKFVVPRNPPDWPKHLVGLKLGTIFQNIRYNKTFAKNEAEIRSLGIIRKVSVANKVQGSNQGGSGGTSGTVRGGGRGMVSDEEDEEEGEEMEVDDDEGGNSDGEEDGDGEDSSEVVSVDDIDV